MQSPRHSPSLTSDGQSRRRPVPLVCVLRRTDAHMSRPPPGQQKGVLGTRNIHP